MQELYPFYSISQIQKIFSESALSPQKKWGQNFLIDPNIVRKILQVPKTEQIQHVDVLAEIGSGLGALTHKLVQFEKPIYAFEIDSFLVKYLQEQSYVQNAQIQIIHGNFLETLDILVDKSVYFFGNLPYYISSEILIKIFQKLPLVKGGVFLLQKEFVERITKETSSLSIFLHAFGKWKQEMVVSKNCFYPKPNVDSAVLSFVSHDERILDFSKIPNLELVLRGFFWGKRKTISKILDSSPFFESHQREKLRSIVFENLRKTGKERPEDFQFQEYYEIAKQLEL